MQNLCVQGVMEERNSKERGRCVVDTSSSTTREEDLISKLPDALISKVLSYLSTKEAVGTSVLSSRWKSLWLFFISEIDLDTCQFRCLCEFYGKVSSFLQGREAMLAQGQAHC